MRRMATITFLLTFCSLSSATDLTMANLQTAYWSYKGEERTNFAENMAYYINGYRDGFLITEMMRHYDTTNLRISDSDAMSEAQVYYAQLQECTLLIGDDDLIDRMLQFKVDEDDPMDIDIWMKNYYAIVCAGVIKKPTLGQRS